MPINRKNQKTFHRHLYAGMNETVTLHKRGNDQRQGTVTKYLLFQCRWSKIYKAGEPLQADMSSAHSRRLHIPVIELERNGIAFINAADEFIDKEGRHWRPESKQTITVQLIQQHFCVDCVRCDPPNSGGS